MIYLLDTHTFIWSALESGKLSPKSIQIISDRNNDILVGTISFWEISLKVKMKRYSFDGIEIKTFPDIAVKMGFNILPLDADDAITFNNLSLKNNHKDPFDRMLIWQAIKRNYVMISKDSLFGQYKKDGLKIVW